LSRAGEFGMGGGPVHIHVHIGDEEFEEFIVEKLSGTLRLQGA